MDEIYICLFLYVVCVVSVCVLFLCQSAELVLNLQFGSCSPRRVVKAQ